MPNAPSTTLQIVKVVLAQWTFKQCLNYWLCFVKQQINSVVTT